MSFQARPVRCFPCLYLLHSATVSHWGEELSPHSHYHILHPRPDYGRSEVGGEGGNRVYPGICKHPVYLMLDIEQSHVDRGLHTWTLSILFWIKTIIGTVRAQLQLLSIFIVYIWVRIPPWHEPHPWRQYLPVQLQIIICLNLFTWLCPANFVIFIREFDLH